ncbi:hypothetical protein PG991_012238 [Apiospora marii]|uniref:Uncharacterized protein n=1 Tax=Apiospora marii TaxID=335849 RepID=A0ABR1R9C6_9PEZI
MDEGAAAAASQAGSSSSTTTNATPLHNGPAGCDSGPSQRANGRPAVSRVGAPSQSSEETAQDSLALETV